MGYISLASMTKVAIGTVVAGGIMVSGITWQGDGSVTNIRGNIDSLQDKLTSAMEDNEFLKNQFVNLQGLYNGAVQEANGTIKTLQYQKDELESQIADLQDQVDGYNGDLSDAQVELQNEIIRLEGELDRANQQIAELEEYASTVDDSSQYEAVDRTQFEVVEQEVKDIDDSTPSEPTTPSTYVPIDENALAFNQTKAETMASPLWVDRINNEFEINNLDLEIIGVSTYVYAETEILSYIVRPFDSTVTSVTPELRNLMNAIGETYLMFEYEDGTAATYQRRPLAK